MWGTYSPLIALLPQAPDPGLTATVVAADGRTETSAAGDLCVVDEHIFLLTTVVISFLGSIGLSVLIIEKVLGQDPDPFYPLICFVFLVALGVDYNIFLMSRVREEARDGGTRQGMLRALVATGPVITSAGLILAGTFATLTALPLWILLEIGLTVAVGILIDTFLVRTVAVPALVTLFGERSWWPSSATAKGPRG